MTELHVNVMLCELMSAGLPLISCVLFTSTVVLNKGLVAEVTALVCLSVKATVVPQAACNVALTLLAAVSFKKSKVIVLASKPLTNLCAVSNLLPPLRAG